MMKAWWAAAALAACGAGLGAGLAGCSSAKIAALESVGFAKREQLVDRVEDARDGQEKAKQQFASALEEFLAVTGANGGDLEKKYAALKRELDRSENAAEAVRERVRSVDRVASALFKEWEKELGQYSSESLRRSSERQLADTRRAYDRLYGAMRTAEGKMEPVLAAFRDQTLFLKHNLNARAIASLGDTVREIESDVGALIAEMNASIDEANRFIQQMNEEPAAG